jgi:predicted nucleic acid-binding protein
VKLLLDTNRLSDALAELPEALDALEAAHEVNIPVIALGETRPMEAGRQGRGASQDQAGRLIDLTIREC